MSEEGAWHDGLELDDDVRASVEKFTSVEELAKGHRSQATMLGNALQFPKDDATDDERSEAMGKVYGRLGVPEKADGYVLDKPADLPEGVNWDDAVAASVKTLAHEAHMTQAQLNAFVKFDVNRTVSRMKAMAEAQEKHAKESTAALRAEVGTDKFDNFLAEAQQAYKKIGGDELVALFDETGLKNHPVVVKAFHAIYQKEFAEGRALEGAAATAVPADYFNYPSMDGKG